jgi:flagellar M-ring protein FliF
LLAALAVSVALGVGVALWSQSPNYALLYGSLSGNDGAEVLEALSNAGISFRVQEDSGAILVPADSVHEARLKLAAQGLPKGTALGFELLDRKQSLGTSQFIERARYQHALEVELARTIASVNSVQSARVHLALPRQSAFVRNRKSPSASVLVQLHPGRELEDGQAGAVAHIVAAAIPNLEPSRVRVIDQNGRLLTSTDEDDRLGLGEPEIAYAQRLEQAYVKRIERILLPIVGSEGFKAQVALDLDFTRNEQARESFAPDPRAVRSERELDERSLGPGESGVPGALSNQPPGGANVPELLAGEQPGASASQGRQRSRRQATRNYELDRTVSHTESPAGTVQRLSAAVVLDDRRAVAGGEARPWTEDELARITALVKEAVGFAEERGDSVNIVNTSFTKPAPAEPLPEPSFWERPVVWRIAKQIGGVVVVLLLVFGVLRPLLRNLAAREAAERELDQSLEQARLAGPGEGDLASDRLSLAAARSPGARVPGQQGGYDANVQSVRALVSDDPKRVANVVRNWVEDGG